MVLATCLDVVNGAAEDGSGRVVIVDMVISPLRFTPAQQHNRAARTKYIATMDAKPR
jgi:hypothetical protein